MSERKYITKDDYVLTNLSLNGCYCIRINEKKMDGKKSMMFIIIKKIDTLKKTMKRYI